jgi:hypothetical protein
VIEGALKVIVYLCEEHAEKVLSKTIVPMTDDVLICQVPTCFKLATWKYFTTLAERAVSPTAERLPPAGEVSVKMLGPQGRAESIP